jgi:hypothetical protein
MVAGNTSRSTLLSRTAAVAAAVSAVLVVAGCMGITLNREQVVRPDVVKVEADSPSARDDAPRTYPPGDGILEQEGVVTLPRLMEQDVYYPVPYVGPPNLSIESPFQHCVLMSQKADHFRVMNTCNTGPEDVHWKAKGVKVLLGPPPPEVAVPSLPPPDPTPVPSKP